MTDELLSHFNIPKSRGGATIGQGMEAAKQAAIYASQGYNVDVGSILHNVQQTQGTRSRIRQVLPSGGRIVYGGGGGGYSRPTHVKPVGPDYGKLSKELGIPKDELKKLDQDRLKIIEKKLAKAKNQEARQILKAYAEGKIRSFGERNGMIYVTGTKNIKTAKELGLPYYTGYGLEKTINGQVMVLRGKQWQPKLLYKIPRTVLEEAKREDPNAYVIQSKEGVEKLATTNKKLAERLNKEYGITTLFDQYYNGGFARTEYKGDYEASKIVQTILKKAGFIYDQDVINKIVKNIREGKKDEKQLEGIYNFKTKEGKIVLTTKKKRYVKIDGTAEPTIYEKLQAKSKGIAEKIIRQEPGKAYAASMYAKPENLLKAPYLFFEGKLKGKTDAEIRRDIEREILTPTMQELVAKRMIQDKDTFILTTAMQSTPGQLAEAIATGYVIGGAAHYALPKTVKLVSKATPSIVKKSAKELVKLAGKSVPKSEVVREVGRRALLTAPVAATTGYQVMQVTSQQVSAAEKAGMLGKVALQTGGFVWGFEKGFSTGFAEVEKLKLLSKGVKKSKVTDWVEEKYLKEPGYPSTKGTQPEKLLKEFKEGKYTKHGPFKAEGMIHMTEYGGSFKKGFVEIQPGNSETFGLYGAPSGSPLFLRIPLTNKMIKLSRTRIRLLPPESPATIFVKTKVGRIPASVRAKYKTIEKLDEWLYKHAADKAYITPAYELGKTEKEAIIPIKEEGKRFLYSYGPKYFFELKGHVVPVVETELVGSIDDIIKNAKKATGTSASLEELIYSKHIPPSPFIAASLYKSTSKTSVTKPSRTPTKIQPSYLVEASKLSLSSTPVIPSLVSISSYSSKTKTRSVSRASKTRTSRVSKASRTRPSEVSKISRGSVTEEPKPLSTPHISIVLEPSRIVINRNYPITRPPSIPETTEEKKPPKPPTPPKAVFLTTGKKKAVVRKAKPVSVARKYKPSLAGMVYGVTISKAPKYVTGAGIRGILVKKTTKKNAKSSKSKKKSVKKAKRVKKTKKKKKSRSRKKSKK